VGNMQVSVRSFDVLGATASPIIRATSQVCHLPSIDETLETGVKAAQTGRPCARFSRQYPLHFCHLGLRQLSTYR